MKCNLGVAILVLAALHCAGAVGQTLALTPVFQGQLMAPKTDGTMQPIGVSVQSWELASGEGGMYEIPLRGFYVAHLLGGNISTSIDGQTTSQPPGAYWAVKSGATMKVKVNGQSAILETILITRALSP
jgi:hypothetical protein